MSHLMRTQWKRYKEKLHRFVRKIDMMLYETLLRVVITNTRLLCMFVVQSFNAGNHDNENLGFKTTSL